MSHQSGASWVSGLIDDLPRLRTWNDSFEVRVFATLEGSFLTFSLALDATPLLFLLLLSAGTFSLAFFHAFSWGVNEILDAVGDRDAVRIGSGPARP